MARFKNVRKLLRLCKDDKSVLFGLMAGVLSWGLGSYSIAKGHWALAVAWDSSLMAWFAYLNWRLVHEELREDYFVTKQELHLMVDSRDKWRDQATKNGFQLTQAWENLKESEAERERLMGTLTDEIIDEIKRRIREDGL
jgi:hypothetical protein